MFQPSAKEVDLDPSMVFGVHVEHSAKQPTKETAPGVPTAYTILLFIAVVVAATAHTDVFSHAMEAVSLYGATTLYTLSDNAAAAVSIATTHCSTRNAFCLFSVYA